jgi:FAD:protein FMN transferase
MLAGCATTRRSATNGAETKPLVRVQRSQPLLGTFITITAFGENEHKLQEAVSAGFEEIRQVDFLLSIHKTNSETARVNRTAAIQPTRISGELGFVLSESLKIARRTDGAFDPTIGPLAQLWGFIWKEYRLPSKAELARVLPLVDYRKVVLETNGETARAAFARPGMFFDFGGIGKGYAVDRAIEVLREHEVGIAMVKAGGDLRVIGTPPGEKGWVVQIEDPLKEGERTTVLLREGALSTSGNYENFFEVGGRRYSHIIDPRSGMPVEGVVSCTVTADRCIDSDAYATAFFVMGSGRALKEFGDEFGIRMVDSNFQVRESAKFPK